MAKDNLEKRVERLELAVWHGNGNPPIVVDLALTKERSNRIDEATRRAEEASRQSIEAIKRADLAHTANKYTLFGLILTLIGIIIVLMREFRK